ncbi:hypothetical protein K7X08_003939 [Anisodus acutangulus]|uniref:Uncharacterized protein n=1 Tax=Anisodus acutangulus TaxID=402998 RepID=A0A9Q1MJH1_9SOLA|nr:hypothetical protein K7X08_003939 [Anisodus acutangulus]
MASSNPKDFSKKKRVSRSAKLKQCKLDARREQCLSQVKNKGSKEEPYGGGGACGQGMYAANERGKLIEKIAIQPRGGGEEENGGGSSSSSSGGGCCSGSMSEEDNEGHDGCLDDWEAVADALAATDKKQEQHNSSLDSAPERDDNVVHMSSQPEFSDRNVSGTDMSQPKPMGGITGEALYGDVKVYQYPHHVLYAVRIWILQIQAFSLVLVGLGFVSFVTRGFLRRMGGAQFGIEPHNAYLPHYGLLVRLIVLISFLPPSMYQCSASSSSNYVVLLLFSLYKLIAFTRNGRLCATADLLLAVLEVQFL